MLQSRFAADILIQQSVDWTVRRLGIFASGVFRTYVVETNRYRFHFGAYLSPPKLRL